MRLLPAHTEGHPPQWGKVRPAGTATQVSAGGDPASALGGHDGPMTDMWIARVWDLDVAGQSIHFMITDGADQRRIALHRTQHPELYDFVVQHVSDPR